MVCISTATSKLWKKECLNQADSRWADTAVGLKATAVVIQRFINFNQRRSPSPLQFQETFTPCKVFLGGKVWDLGRFLSDYGNLRRCLGKFLVVKSGQFSNNHEMEIFYCLLMRVCGPCSIKHSVTSH